jgi:MFS family permease
MPAFLPSLLFFGFAFGSPLIGFISSKFGGYYTILISCAAVMLVGFYLVLYHGLGLNTYILVYILVAIGIASAYQTLVIYLASVLVPKQIVGLTTACSNMVMMMFGYFFHSVIGAAASGGINDPQTVVSALSIIPYSLGVAIIGLLLFKKFASDKEHV